MAIPIENVYYLLSYAWNKLDPDTEENISISDQTKLIDLLAKIFINTLKRLLLRGLDKYYINISDELPGIKGKLNVSQTIKRDLLRYQKTNCSFDEFSVNILSNRIIYTILNILIKIDTLDTEVKSELIKLRRNMPNIDLLNIRDYHFNETKLNRNNKYYNFIMNVCHLIYKNALLSEEPGRYRFNDFTKDEKKMSVLYEAFIRNFYRIEKDKHSFNVIGREDIKWQFNSNDINSAQYLPIMQTDITMENELNKIIIDAKYYQETVQSHYNKEVLHSSNVYQLFSYLINQEDGSEKKEKTKGILLYPTVTNEYNLDYKYKSHKICIRTLNLNMAWKQISDRLISIANEML